MNVALRQFLIPGGAAIAILSASLVSASTYAAEQSSAPSQEIARVQIADATDQKIDVTLDDESAQSMMMNVSPADIKAGKITFNITNQSTGREHEFVVVRSDLDFDAVPFAKVDKTEVDESKLQGMGEAEDIEPGKTAVLTLDLKPGRYLLICNEPGHYKAGMHTVLNVTQ